MYAPDSTPLFHEREIETFKRDWSKHKENWFLLKEIFDLCHKIRNETTGITDNQLIIQLRLLIGIADTIRIIKIAMVFGYPHQIAALYASIWEMTQLIICFEHRPDKIERYIELESTADVTKILADQNGKPKKWKDCVKYNTCSILNNLMEGVKLSHEEEYEIYKKVCNIKHPHPKHINRFKKTEEGIEIPYAPYAYDDRRYDVKQVSRSTLLALQVLTNKGKLEKYKNQLNDLIEKYKKFKS